MALGQASILIPDPWWRQPAANSDFPSYQFSRGRLPDAARGAILPPVSGGFGQALSNVIADPIQFKKIFDDTGGREGRASREGSPPGGGISASQSGNQMGRGPGPSFNEIGSAVGSLGTALSGVSGLGMVGGVVGSLADAYDIDETARAQGLPTLSVGQVVRGTFADLVPFGLGRALGLPTFESMYQNNYMQTIGGFLQPEQMYNTQLNDYYGNPDPYGTADPYGPSPSWDTDIANRADNFGGWGETTDVDAAMADADSASVNDSMSNNNSNDGTDGEGGGGGGAAGGGSGGSGGSGNDTDDW